MELAATRFDLLPEALADRGEAHLTAFECGFQPHQFHPVTATGTDGKHLGAGRIEVLSPESVLIGRIAIGRLLLTARVMLDTFCSFCDF